MKIRVIDRPFMAVTGLKNICTFMMDIAFSNSISEIALYDITIIYGCLPYSMQIA